MNRVLTPAAVLLSVAILFTSTARAMEIQQFDKMASEDKGEYVGLLVGSAEQVLKDEGRADLAAKVEQLFTTTEPGDQHTLGMVEFQLNLARARVADSEKAAKDANARRLEVEDAMFVTLKKSGIELPDTFFAIGIDFKPASLSPKSPVADGTNSASRPMITHNPNGTFTVQKEPPNGNSKDIKATKGLVIPAQVVVPLFSTPEKKK